ncbi:UDP-4-amino-4,6-dideoxy-N-acetyl-beta-L-altrosami ne transaminase [Actinoplanes italicus]|uniref:dTDP-4-amino-4,6-dideoxygalactose transaminase n=1 Tax=Actinoplanes italicus TaxID=113567 RepID=A0A2T0JX31_9ACTN|nr:aminotransferase class I/II-fold pyridoxal phosphate-dependent enzyme [Actinoplanes italicus]PRX12426.1 dTDP-4-amino-4,6-dideoxygalactose transaminase [Actinoplanes italicus]GIE35545.1 UDP-4-amino-4,6-dideoxy-N-acetyl-beta-L-altrosami ne transaminase [Actinoplanes italicus]
MLPYGRQSIDDSDVDAVVAALGSDWLTTGPRVARFEADLEEVAGAPCVTVTNGTTALHAAYAAAGVTSGDEVVTTPMTFVATASGAALLGATVVFADVEEDTANIDPAAVEATVTSRTRVIAAVDYAGVPADYDRLRKVTDEAGAILLGDAAHSIGSTYRGRPVGSLADLTTFSFFPTKNLTTGEGGAVASIRPDLLQRVRTFRTVGLVRDPDRLRHPDEGGWHQEVHEFGLNYRLPDVLCALGSAQLRRLAEFKTRRARLTARYDELLADVPGLRLPVRRSDVDPVRHLYPVRILDGRRREVYDRLRAAGIGVQVNYIPVYWHPVFEDLGYRRGMCPVAERFYAEELSLPLFADLSDSDQDRVVEALRGILGS